MSPARPGRDRLARPAAFLCAALSAATALAGCGDEPPSVSAVEWRLEARPAEGGDRYESLAAFASIKGGAEDAGIEELWVVEDAAALAWKMTSDDWIKTDSGGDSWIGGAPLAMNDFGPLPRGEYRVVAIDPAGQRAERGFTIGGDFPSLPSPSLSMDDRGILVSSSWPENLVIAYDGAGELVVSVPAPSARSSISALLGTGAASRAAELAAYGYDPGMRMGAYSARTALK